MKILLEELGSNCQVDVEVEIEFDYSPAEPMVRYYSDGSGYPGCDEYFDVTNVTALSFKTFDNFVVRDEKLDWFERLDHILLNFCSENEYIKERILNEHY